MNELTNYHHLARALLEGMEYARKHDARLELIEGEIPKFPLSPHEPINRIWYSPSIVLSHDLEEKINLANPAALERFGYGLHEFIGTPSELLVPGNLREARREAFNRILKIGIPEYFENSPRFTKTGEITLISGWAFRYNIGSNYSIGALLLP